LSGNLPFMGRSQKELFRKIVAGKFEFKDTEWDGVSDDAKDLVSKMLVLNPDKRMTAKKALLHPWLKVATERLSKIGLNSTSQRLKTFNAKMKLRSAMIAVDYVSSLMQVSGMSSRNLAASTSSGSSKGSDNSLSMANRRRRRTKEEMVSI
jgi:calcium/calmodulin-dependent protein kinase I